MRGPRYPGGPYKTMHRFSGPDTIISPAFCCWCRRALRSLSIAFGHQHLRVRCPPAFRRRVQEPRHGPRRVSILPPRARAHYPPGTSRASGNRHFTLSRRFGRKTKIFLNIFRLQVRIVRQNLSVCHSPPSIRKTVATGIRKPQMQASLPIWPGSRVMRSKLVAIAAIENLCPIIAPSSNLSHKFRK